MKYIYVCNPVGVLISSDDFRISHQFITKLNSPSSDSTPYIYHVLPTFHICLMSPLEQLTSLRMGQSLDFVGGDCKVLWNLGNVGHFAPCHLFQGDQRMYCNRSNFTFETWLGVAIFFSFIYRLILRGLFIIFWNTSALDLVHYVHSLCAR